MGRRRVEHKASNISISLPFHQIQFINNHNTFSLSEFVRIHLQEYIDLTNEVEKVEKEVGMNGKTKIE